MTVILQDRLDAVADIPLSVSSHSAPPADGKPCGFCRMEKWAWVTGQDWTDHPDNCSQVIGAFLRRFQDLCDHAGALNVATEAGLKGHAPTPSEKLLVWNVEVLVAAGDETFAGECRRLGHDG